MQCLSKLRCMFLYRNGFYNADYGRSAWACPSGKRTHACYKSGFTGICKRSRKTGSQTRLHGKYETVRYCNDGKLWKCNPCACCNFRQYKLSASYSGTGTWIWNRNYRRYIWQTAPRRALPAWCPSGRKMACWNILLCRRRSGDYGRNQGTSAFGCYDSNRKDTRRESGRFKEKRILWALWKVACTV